MKKTVVIALAVVCGLFFTSSAFAQCSGGGGVCNRGLDRGVRVVNTRDSRVVVVNDRDFGTFGSRLFRSASDQARFVGRRSRDILTFSNDELSRENDLLRDRIRRLENEIRILKARG